MPGYYEQCIVLPTLRDLNRQAGAVPARMLADLLGKSDRTARVYLRRLEQSGMVIRPHGPKSGWMYNRVKI